MNKDDCIWCKKKSLSFNEHWAKSKRESSDHTTCGFSALNFISMQKIFARALPSHMEPTSFTLLFSQRESNGYVREREVGTHRVKKKKYNFKVRRWNQVSRTEIFNVGASAAEKIILWIKKESNSGSIKNIKKRFIEILISSYKKLEAQDVSTYDCCIINWSRLTTIYANFKNCYKSIKWCAVFN